MALLEEDGQNCGRGIRVTEIPQTTKTDHEWGEYPSVGNGRVEDDGRRLEDDEDGIDEEDAGGEA